MTRTELICWIDTMRPASVPQWEGWAFYLSLHRSHWPAIRIMFRKVHQGIAPGVVLGEFLAATGLNDRAMQRHLEFVLGELSKEAMSP